MGNQPCFHQRRQGRSVCNCQRARASRELCSAEAIRALVAGDTDGWNWGNRNVTRCNSKVHPSPTFQEYELLFWDGIWEQVQPRRSGCLICWDFGAKAPQADLAPSSGGFETSWWNQHVSSCPWGDLNILNAAEKQGEGLCVVGVFPGTARGLLLIMSPLQIYTAYPWPSCVETSTLQNLKLGNCGFKVPHKLPFRAHCFFSPHDFCEPQPKLVLGWERFRPSAGRWRKRSYGFVLLWLFSLAFGAATENCTRENCNVKVWKKHAFRQCLLQTEWTEELTE